MEIDEIATNVISSRPGASFLVVWSTKGFPVDDHGFGDPSNVLFGTTIDKGTVFRVDRYEFGVPPATNHTDFIDCAVVMSGSRCSSTMASLCIRGRAACPSNGGDTVLHGEG